MRCRPHERRRRRPAAHRWYRGTSDCDKHVLSYASPESRAEVSFPDSHIDHGNPGYTRPRLQRGLTRVVWPDSGAQVYIFTLHGTTCDLRLKPTFPKYNL